MITKLNTSPVGGENKGIGVGTILLLAAIVAGVGYYFYKTERKTH